MHKRLKGLEECEKIQIADEKAVNRIIRENAAMSKTHQNNHTPEKQYLNTIPFTPKKTVFERIKTVIDILFKVAVIFIAFIIFLAMTQQ